MIVESRKKQVSLVIALMGMIVVASLSSVRGFPNGSTQGTVANVSLNLSHIAADVGKAFTVNLSISNVVNLWAYEIMVWYENSVLNALNVTRPEGHFLQPEDPSMQIEIRWTIANDYNATHGRIWLAFSLLSPEVGRTGSGVLSTITFQGISMDTSILKLIHINGDHPTGNEGPVKLADSLLGGPIRHTSTDGKATIGSDSIADVQVVPSYTFVEINETFTIDIYVADVTDLFAYDIKIWFDRSVIEATNATRPVGNFLEPQIDQNNELVSEWEIDNELNATHGGIWLACTLLVPEVGRNGSGVLARLSFVSVSERFSSIILQNDPGNAGPVTFRSTNSSFITHTVTDGIVRVGFAEPVAVFVYEPTAPKTGEVVTFGASGSYDMDGRIVEYCWFFGDLESGSGQIAYHVYSEPGYYSVLLRVKDNDGQYGFASGSIYVFGAEHDLTVALRVPSLVPIGASVILNATATNFGFANETDVGLTVWIDDSLVLDAVLPVLESSGSYTASYLWKPTSVKTYNVTAKVTSVEGEPDVVNNRDSSFVSIGEAIIHPQIGQYANYVGTFWNGTTEIEQHAYWNLTYAEYLTPTVMSVISSLIDVDNRSSVSPFTVGILTREMSGLPVKQWYYGWIETNVTIGSEVKLLTVNGTVRSEQTIQVLGISVDCWVVEMAFIGPDQNASYSMWFDKATGVWIGMEYDDAFQPGIHGVYQLVETNIQIGSSLRIVTDKPGYKRFEAAKIDCSLTEDGLPVKDASITIEVSYPNGTLYFSTALMTDVNGSASLDFLIEQETPLGIYVVHAASSKQGLEPRTAITTFAIACSEPHVIIWFDGLESVLINENSTVILHIRNDGDAIAFNVNASLHLPDTMTIVSSNTTFAGDLSPGNEVLLVAVVAASSPSDYSFTANATYEGLDGVPMPSLESEWLLAVVPEYSVFALLPLLAFLSLALLLISRRRNDGH